MSQPKVLVISDRWADLVRLAEQLPKGEDDQDYKDFEPCSCYGQGPCEYCGRAA